MKTSSSWKPLLLAAAALTLLPQGRAAADAPGTVAECDDAYEECFASLGFFGYFYCPPAHAQCVAQVRSRLPPELIQMLNQVDSCSQVAALCRTAAEGAQDQLASCAQRRDSCVINAFGAAIAEPPEAKQDRLCVEIAVRCLSSSKTVSNLEACQSSLSHCLSTPTPPP